MTSGIKLFESIADQPWSQHQPRYRLCVFGDQNLLQTGDVVMDLQERASCIQYFTFSESDPRRVQVVVCQVYHKKKLPSVWQAFVKQDQWVKHPKMSHALDLGEIKLLKSKKEVQWSDYEWSGKALVGTNRIMKTPRMDRDWMIKSYLCMPDAMLRYHPLVRSAAEALAPWRSGRDITPWILENFSYWQPHFDNADHQVEDDSLVVFRKIGKIHGKCRVCGVPEPLMCAETCETCFVRIRELFEFFGPLENLRINSQHREHISEAEFQELRDNLHGRV